jgi:hypothetical protein
MQYLLALKDERGGKCKTETLDEDPKDLDVSIGNKTILIAVCHYIFLPRMVQTNLLQFISDHVIL